MLCGNYRSLPRPIDNSLVGYYSIDVYICMYKSDLVLIQISTRGVHGITVGCRVWGPQRTHIDLHIIYGVYGLGV